MQFNPERAQYIKLGKGGAWASEAIAAGTLPFGYSEIGHEACASGDWEAVRSELLDCGWSKGGASKALRELKAYYEFGRDTLWITFADGHLWWGFAEPEVKHLGLGLAPSRQRRMIGGWRKTALDGTPLTTRSLSSALTRTAGYRMTLCDVKREDYLLRRIGGEDDPRVAEARSLQSKLANVATELVLDLDWRDWEILVDLVMTRAGWRRLSAIGDGEVDIDLLLEQPTTGETAWVQIKTSTSQSELDDYVARYKADGSCDRFFYVCHGLEGLRLKEADPRMHLWQASDVAHQAIEAGLLEWVMKRHA